MRTFETGATRDSDDSKLDFEGFLSPYALEAYAAYMHKHRKQADGSMRASDNWQKGIPADAYMKSMWRHFHEVWTLHRSRQDGAKPSPKMQEALSALFFNVHGYLHEISKHTTYTYDPTDPGEYKTSSHMMVGTLNEYSNFRLSKQFPSADIYQEDELDG